jgi:hypothetical protein
LIDNADRDEIDAQIHEIAHRSLIEMHTAGIMDSLAKVEFSVRENLIRQVLSAIKEEYCLHCGSDSGSSCPCQNDD